MSSELKIGEKLYQPRGRAEDWYMEYEVVAIGRKWAMLKPGGRCEIKGLLLDCGGYAPQRLYRTKEEHQEERRIAVAWGNLRRDIQYARRPTGITVEKINELRRVLELDVTEAA